MKEHDNTQAPRRHEFLPIFQDDKLRRHLVVGTTKSEHCNVQLNADGVLHDTDRNEDVELKHEASFGQQLTQGSDVEHKAAVEVQDTAHAQGVPQR